MTDNWQPATKLDGPTPHAAVSVAPPSQPVTRDLHTRHGTGARAPRAS